MSHCSWSGQGTAAAALRGRTKSDFRSHFGKRGLPSIVYVERSKVSIKLMESHL